MRAFGALSQLRIRALVDMVRLLYTVVGVPGGASYVDIDGRASVFALKELIQEEDDDLNEVNLENVEVFVAKVVVLCCVWTPPSME